MKKLKYGHEVSHTSKVIYSRNNEGIFSLSESAIYFPGISVKLRFVMHGVLTKFSSKRRNSILRQNYPYSLRGLQINTTRRGTAVK